MGCRALVHVGWKSQEEKDSLEVRHGPALRSKQNSTRKVEGFTLAIQKASVYQKSIQGR